jgi:hypothetical protein
VSDEWLWGDVEAAAAAAAAAVADPAAAGASAAPVAATTVCARRVHWVVQPDWSVPKPLTWINLYILFRFMGCMGGSGA